MKNVNQLIEEQEKGFKQEEKELEQLSIDIFFKYLEFKNMSRESEGKSNKN